MIIHNLECRELHNAIHAANDTKILMKFDAWVNNKPKTDAQFTETDEKIIKRYCELRDKYLGGPLYIIKAQHILDIEHEIQAKIPVLFEKDAAAGKELMRSWSVFRNKVHLPYNKQITQSIKVGCGYIIVSKEVFELYKKYEAQS